MRDSGRDNGLHLLHMDGYLHTQHARHPGRGAASGALGWAASADAAGAAPGGVARGALEALSRVVDPVTGAWPTFTSADCAPGTDLGAPPQTPGVPGPWRGVRWAGELALMGAPDGKPVAHFADSAPSPAVAITAVIAGKKPFLTRARSFLFGDLRFRF